MFLQNKIINKLSIMSDQKVIILRENSFTNIHSMIVGQIY
jgi:hypothetical protein